MSLIKLNNITRSFGAQDVLLGINQEINAGDAIGFVGRNGVGKTTLLKMIAGVDKSTSGHMNFASDVRVGYLVQDPHYPEGRTLYQEVREGIAALDSLEQELRTLEERLADETLMEDADEYKRILERYSRVQEQFEQREGWRADSRVEAILDGLKVARQDWERDVSTFSGGERNVIGLARILVQEPDVMLLDEPGNHLDFEGLDWLESALKQFRGAVVLVSHNRYLLDSVCKSIWELENGKIEPYAGNYSAYRAEKLQKLERQEAEVKRAQREAGRLKFQIQRLKSWASVYDNPKLARTAKRFEKRVEELESKEVKREDTRKIGLQFGAERTKGDIALDVRHYSKQFGDAPPLFKDVTVRLQQGDTAALVGPNGTGKSTFLKDVLQEARWENETLRMGKAMRVGYLSQMGDELERKNDLITELLRMSGLRRNEGEALLYRFMFKRDDFEKNVGVLSGGERVRLQLAALMSSDANFLILDEPTNHLDVFSREAVEDALEEYPGTLLVVSHDRYFLDKIARRVLFVQNADMESFDGNFSEFWYKWKDLREAEQQQLLEAEKREKEKTKSKRNLRRVRFNAERFKFLEEEIARLEAQKERLSGEIDREREKGNRKREQQKRDTFARTEADLEEIYEEWFAMGDKKNEY